MKLQRRQKQEMEKPLIKRRKKADQEGVLIKRRKIEISEEIVDEGVRRNEEVILLKNKQHCSKHKGVKISFKQEICPLCESNRIISSNYSIIDEQRQVIKKGFEEVYERLLLRPDYKEKETPNLLESNTLEAKALIKKRRRKHDK